MMGFLRSIAVPLQRKHLGIVCCIAVIAVIIATLWPFDFSPANEVTWLPDSPGLRFSGTSVVLSDAPLDAGAVGLDQSCSLEILLRPARIRSLATILSFYSPGTPSEFKFFREGNTLEISRSFLNSLEDSKWPTFRADNLFENGKLLFLTIASGKDGTTIYTNGGQPRVLPQLQIRAGDLTGRIILGTAATRFEPYSGEIRGLAIYVRELAPAEVLRDFAAWASGRTFGPANTPGAIAVYRFDERNGDVSHSAVGLAPDLQIPRQYVLPSKPFLESPADEFRYQFAYVFDLVENVLGFMPLGLIFCAYFSREGGPRMAIVYATVVGGALSLAVEIAQFYVPSRGSGITDVIANTAGAALGALLVRQVHFKD